MTTISPEPDCGRKLQRTFAYGRHWAISPRLFFFGALKSIALAVCCLAALFTPNGGQTAPVVTATKTDQLFVDNNGNLQPDPGDTLRYTVVITNFGTDALGVLFSDLLDTNTTLLPASVRTTPLALNDNYSALGNVQISIAAPGVLANDADPDGVGPALTVTPFTGASANGGNVSLSANGSFTYNPPPGFEGTDTFTYTLNDNDAPNTTDSGTVSITVTGMIWFVNSAAGAGGDGRLTSPFNTLTGAGSFNSVAADGPGDNIFLYSGSYAGGLTLLNNQKLIGQGATASLATITGLTPPTGSLALPATGGARPTVGAAVNNITLGSGNLMRGLNLNNTGGTALLGASVGSLTVSEASVTNTTGTAINMANGTLAATFNSVSANGGANGIKLVNTSGSFLVSGSGGAGSGGFIQNSIGVDGSTNGCGVYLSNVSNVLLASMTLVAHPNFAIRGVTVTGFTFTNSSILGTNGNNAAFDEGSLSFSDLFGSALISGCTILGGLEDNVRVANASGTLNRLTMQNTTIGINGTALGDDGMFVEASGSAVLNVTVTNCVFTSARGDLLQCNALNNAVMNWVIVRNSFSNNHPAIVSGGGGTTFSGGGAGSAVTVTYDISNNTFRDAQGIALNVFKGTGGGNFSGTISNNTIGVSGVANSGSAQASGIQINSSGTGTHTTRIENNTIRRYNENGIYVRANDGNSTINATILNNTVNQPDAFGLNGVQFNIGGLATDANFACVDLRNNTLAGSGPFAGDDFNLRQRFSTTIKLPNYAGAANSTAAVIAFVQANNFGPPDGTASVSGSGGGFVGGTPCVLPLLAAGGGVEAAAPVEMQRGLTTPLPSDELFATPTGVTLAAEPALDVSALNQIIAAAKQRWQKAGLTEQQFAAINSVKFELTDIGGWCLGSSSEGLVQLDRSAAGHGWFIDPTPLDDAEFTGPVSKTRAYTTTGHAPAGRIDLLTTVMHEMGHAAGLVDANEATSRDDLMHGSLTVGERRLPLRNQAAGAIPGSIKRTQFVFTPIPIGTLPSGKSITVSFQVTINSPLPGGICQLANQGTVSGDNFTTVVTDDPDTGVPNDATLTPVNQPDVPVITPIPPTVLSGSSGNQASGPAAQAAYAWTIGNGTITSATNLQTITYTAGGAGSVTLGLTVFNAGGCGTNTSILIPITTPPAPTPGCPLPASYVASTTFTDGLASTTMTLAFDGTNYWSCSGGGVSGNRLARYDATGALLNTYAPGLDFRSVFTTANGTVLARAFNSPIIYRQTSPGVFISSGVSLTGGTLNAQSSVVLNGAGTEYLATSGSTVSRWSTNGTYLGSVTLQGFGTVSGENNSPQNRGIAAAGAYWLTYNGNQILSIWDTNGNRLAQITLAGAGTGSNAGYSLSYCNGKVWIVDAAGGTWRGYDVFAPVRFAVLAAESNNAWNQDVRNKILGAGAIAEVDVIRITTGDPVPTLIQLSRYRAALVYSDNAFNNGVTLGNVLADYVDQGGGVVLATFAFYDSGGLAIQGRLKTGNYLPFTTGGQNQPGGLTLVKDLPQHPSLSGVNSFAGGSSYHNSPISITNGATLVASWSNGQPLVGAKQSGPGRVVGLNFFPPSSDALGGGWVAGTDGARLLANALLWTGQHPPVIVTGPTNRLAVVGETVTFGVSLTGSAPLTYQWRKGGISLPGETGTNLTFTAQLSSAGQYSVVVSNLCDVAISSNATLTVLPSTNLVLAAVDRGWYNATGFHSPGSQNYFVGNWSLDPYYHNWFVFNIPPLAAPVIRAELRVQTYDIISPTGNETYQLHEVTTPTATVQAGGSSLTNIYNDLGDGPIYAARAFLNAETNRVVSILLNQTLRTAVTAAAGGPFAFGGELFSLDADASTTEAVFSSSDAGVLELVLTVGTGDVPVAGYFTDNDTSKTGLAGPILSAGFTPLYIGNISTQNFSGLRVLLINEASNGSISPALASRLPDIEAWVRAGGRLIIHDRIAGNLNPNPFLLGTSGLGTVRLDTSNVDLVDPATTLVTAGPFGILSNTSLDGGNSSAHGYVPTAALPTGARAILSTAPNQVACFSYPLGAGFVHYSTIPLDCYLPGSGCNGSVIAAALTAVYTPNVISYAHELRAPLRFRTPALAGGGMLPLYLENADGTPIAATRVSQIRVYATADLTQPPGSWTLLSNPLVLINGLVRVDGVSATNSSRFFRAVEIP